MTNAELIKALRRCSYTTVAGADREDGYCKPCAYFAEDTSDITCIDRMMIDAADALEAAVKRIEELSLDNKMLKNTIDADKGVMLDRIRFLEAQLPKEGEWVWEDSVCSPRTCSVCKQKFYIGRGWNYCPNCGAKMRG